MGWIEVHAWNSAVVLEPSVEALLLDRFHANCPQDFQVIGVDCYGADVCCASMRRRLRFESILESPEEIEAHVRLLLPGF